MNKLLLFCFFALLSLNGFAQATANQPANLSACGDVFDLTQQSATILGSQPLGQYTVKYYQSLFSAQNDVNAISTPAAFTGVTDQVIYARVTNTSNNTFATTSFSLFVIEVPVVEDMPDMTGCDYLTLPLPTVGDYFTGPYMSGSYLNWYEPITESMTIYLCAENMGCWDQDVFTVTIVDSPEIIPPFQDVTACGGFVLPGIDVGSYYTQPMGQGELLPAGTLISSSTPIYVYADNGNCNSQYSANITIVQPLQITELPDITICDAYVLPALQSGESYFTGPNGTGTQINLGDIITESATIHIFATDATGVCTANSSFEVTIGLPDVEALGDLTICTESSAEFAVFNLTDITAQIQYSNPEYEISFHESQPDAENGFNAISNPTAYTNPIPNTMAVWIRVSSTALGCWEVMPVTIHVQLCTDNTISGTVTLTTDDCASASPASGVQVTNTLNGVATHTYTNESGDYSFSNVQQGLNTVTITDATGYTSSPSNIELLFENESQSFSENNFCLTAIPVTDVMVMVYPMMPARPGFPVSYLIIVRNIGTTLASGNLSFSYDDQLLNFTSASPGAASNTSGSLSFNFNDLNPLQNAMFTVDFVVEVPPTVVSGTSLLFTAQVTSAQQDSNFENNVLGFTNIAVNSYDPNDKTVVEGSYVEASQTGNYLNYIVRFQNTGTASAINVKITDQLDSKLDWSTFRPVAASHPFQANMSENGFVTFRFDDINLPATQDDEPGSHGYIAYQVKPDADWSQDAIFNTANIYFDFNEPITTNTVHTGIVYLDVTDNDRPAFAIYPNPTTGVFRINHASGFGMQVLVTDMQGKELMRQDNFASDSEMDVSQLTTGIYIVNIISDGKSLVKKLVKQ